MRQTLRRRGVAAGSRQSQERAGRVDFQEFDTWLGRVQVEYGMFRFREVRAGLWGGRHTGEWLADFTGATPAYADYIVFGAFQWARAISDYELLAADDPVTAWRGRMLDLFDGLARKSAAYGG